MIAEVVLNNFSKATDNIYHYAVPKHLESIVKVGLRVTVPFGRGNKSYEAFVINLTDKSEFSNLKEILSVNDEYVYFGRKQVELAEFMVHRYFCSYVSAIKTIIPSGLGTVFTKIILLNDNISSENEEYIEHSLVAKQICNFLKDGPLNFDKLSEKISSSRLSQTLSVMQKRGIVNIIEKERDTISDTIKKRVSLELDYEETSSVIDALYKKAPARARCLEILSDERDMSLAELLEIANTSKSVVDALQKKGYISIYDTVEREDLLSYDCNNDYVRHALTDEQQQVCNSILESIQNSVKDTFLLHGVTGSGKTEVYLELIERAVSLGKDAIFLVPEISLTPQMVAQVTCRFGDRVAVMHSSLTQKQRFEQWKRINEGEVDIVVGARSAVFAPFKNLGIIIIDEEHENTYKSEFSPKYNAVEIAKFRAKQDNAVVLLASATPLVDSTFRAKSGKYKHLFLPNRINNLSLPKTEIIDMREEMSQGNMSIFSRTLVEDIADRLTKGQQTILFLNRRGFSSFVSCRSCGYVAKCPNCNVSLTYHKSIDKLMCHYCDYIHPVYTRCPECQSRYIKHFGIGTQRVADEIKEIFPAARTIRMDADTTSARLSHEKLLKSFRNGEADILIGTQMITKGLDFENVTLVGVIAADMSLNVNDFRAAERTFDLITQVTGRAGRGKTPGKAIIQTYNPDNETIINAANQDYNSFYDEEIELRKMLIYPPFCEFINFVFTSEKMEEAMKIAERFRGELCKVTSPGEAIFYNVAQAPLFKLNGKYRYRLLMKTRYSLQLYKKIAEALKKFSGNKNSVQISVDVNPSNMF